MLSAESHAHLAAHLTARDVWLLHMLWEHRVLTSHHIADLAFTTDRKARRRLLQLHDLGLLDRFRPRLPVGSAPWHYVIGSAGAAVLAAQAGVTPRALRYRRDNTIAIAFHHTLAHTTAINTFFTALVHTSTHPPRPTRTRLAEPQKRGRSPRTPSTHPGPAPAANGVGDLETVRPRLRLQVWWSENRCRHHLDIDARPDAFGRITLHTPPPHPTRRDERRDPRESDHNRRDRRHPDTRQQARRDRPWAFEWFLEIDLGTETLRRLAAKIDRYADLAATTHTATPLLVVLPSRDRELGARTHLTHTLNRLDDPHLIPIATATAPATATVASTGVLSHRAGADLHGSGWVDPEDQAVLDLGPAGPIWLPISVHPTHSAPGRGGVPASRLDLIDLAARWPAPPNSLAAQLGALHPHPTAGIDQPDQPLDPHWSTGINPHLIDSSHTTGLADQAAPGPTGRDRVELRAPHPLPPRPAETRRAARSRRDSHSTAGRDRTPHRDSTAQRAPLPPPGGGRDLGSAPSGRPS